MVGNGIKNCQNMKNKSQLTIEKNIAKYGEIKILRK